MFLMSGLWAEMTAVGEAGRDGIIPMTGFLDSCSRRYITRAARLPGEVGSSCRSCGEVTRRYSSCAFNGRPILLRSGSTS